MIESRRVGAFIWSVLTGDTGPGGVNTALAGRIYHGSLIPAAAPLPAALVTPASSTDVNTLGGDRAFETVLVDVRVSCDGLSCSPIDAIADRIDALLQNRSGSYGGVHIVELRREQPLTPTETEAGKSYSHIIQTYRTEAYAL